MQVAPYRQYSSCERRRSRWALIGLMTGLALGGTILYALAGPPRLPAGLPDLAQLKSVLTGAELPLQAVAYIFTTAAWALWAWLVASVALSLLVVSAEAATRSVSSSSRRGAAWVQGLRRLSEHVTVPLVRRLVDKALVTVVVVQLATRTVPSADAAAPPPTPAIVLSVQQDAPSQSLSYSKSLALSAHQDEGQRVVEYIVQEGDNLWKIAERFYGTGEEYPRIVEANSGHIMPGGAKFTRHGVIRPGWVLEIPLPKVPTGETDEKKYYVVEQGDTLRGIATRFLGDEMRWPEIFRLNESRASVPDGPTLTDPDLIWPGLRLQLPGDHPQETKPGKGKAERPTKRKQKPAQQPTKPPEQGAARSDSTSDDATDGHEPTKPTSTPRKPTPSPTAHPPKSKTPTPTPTSAVPTPSATSKPIERTSTPTAATPPREPTRIATAIAEVSPVHTPTSTAHILGREADVISEEPTSVAGPEVSPTNQRPPEDGDVSAGGNALAVLAAGGAAGLAMLSARRRMRRRLSDPPNQVPPELGDIRTDGFAEPARAFAHRLYGGEPEPAVIVAGRVMQFLDDHGLHGTSIVTARQGRDSVELVLDAGPTEQARLLELAEELGMRLSGTAEARGNSDHDIVLRINGLKQLVLMPAISPSPVAVPLLLPVGAPNSRETLFANWEAMGSVLVAGTPMSGAEETLTSLLCALVSRKRPDDLQLWTVASGRTLPDELASLPHQRGKIVDPADTTAVSELLQELRSETARRLRNGDAHSAEIVVVIGELAELADDGTTLDMLATYGPSRGMRVLAATTRPEALDEIRLSHFRTRLTLQLQDENQSVRLLGRPDAMDLDDRGDMLLKLDGRTPVRIRAFRLGHVQIAQLVRLVQEAYGIPDTATTPSEPAALRWALMGARTDEDDLAVPTEAEPQAGDYVADDPVEAHRAHAVPLQEPPVVEPVTMSTPEAQPFSDEEARHPDQPEPSAYRRSLAVIEPGSRLEQSGQGDAPSSVTYHQDIDAEASVAPIHVSCFGRYCITVNERDLAPDTDMPEYDKPWELLAYLASQPSLPVPRDQILKALWKNQDPDKAAVRLRSVMYRLREVLGQLIPGVDTKVVRCERTGNCYLDVALISSDVHRFVALTQSACKVPPAEAKVTYETARSLYRDELLTRPHYSWVTSITVEDRFSLRDYYREEYFRITDELAELYVSEDKQLLAIPLYEALLAAEPTLEDIACKLYRCYGQIGDRSSLVRAHRQLVLALRALQLPGEEDSELYTPEEETIAVYESVLSTMAAAED